MTRYLVRMRYLCEDAIEVDAPNKQEAAALAQDRITDPSHNSDIKRYGDVIRHYKEIIKVIQ